MTLTGQIVTAIGRMAWWQLVLVIVLAALIYIQVGGLVGTRVLAPAIGWSNDGLQAAGEKVDSVEGRFARWDSWYYLFVAEHGYRPDGKERVFFPLYPLLMRFATWVSGLSLFWTGWIVSISCLVVASLILYRWVLIDHDAQTAKWSVLWLCFFPMSFFFFSIYAEALFLLASLSAFYFARRGQFIASGLAIALAGATRLPAFLLAIPYLIEFLRQGDYRGLRIVKFVVGALIAPLGMAGYLFFLTSQSGRLDLPALLPSIQTTEFDRFLTWPWITLYDGLRSALLGSVIKSDWFSRVEVWQDLLYALFVLLLTIWAFVRLRVSIAAYMLGCMLFFYSSHGPFGYAFWSIPRYVAGVFPIYLGLAALTAKIPDRYRWLPFAASVVLLGLLTAWFVSGRWVA